MGGYAVVGAAKQVWEDEDMLGQIEELEEEGEIAFMGLQMLPLDRPMSLQFKEYGVEGAISQNAIDWETKQEMYVMCTLRKP